MKEPAAENGAPPEGWLPFGSLIDYDGPAECSDETGEDGLPLWERPLPPADGFDARKVADKVRERLEGVGEWTDDDGVQLRMRDGRVERVIPPGEGNDDAAL